MRSRLSMGVALVACMASPLSAQTLTTSTGSASGTKVARGELIPLGGYAWTMSFDVYTGITYGELDLKDAGFFGAALDVNVKKQSAKKAQLRLLYRRSNTTAQFRSGGLAQPIEADASIEYWHIGGLAGVPRGNVLPYATFTVGGTRLVSEGDDTWKFSTMLGLGVKVYKSPKVGFMLQATWPFTFMETWGGVAVGTGGAGVSLGGTGVSQLDVGGGLIIAF